MSRHGLFRALVVTSVVAAAVGGPAAMSFAAAGDPIPGIDVSLEQIPGGLVVGTNPVPEGVPVNGKPVPPEVKVTPALTTTPQVVTLAIKGPKGMSAPVSIPSISASPVHITAFAAKLKGQMDCQLGSETTRPSWTPPSGKIALKYDAINPVTLRPYTSTAYVRMTTGHDPARHDDVAFLGTVIAGVGAGQTFVLDQVMETPGPIDWWNCSQGGAAVSAMNLTSEVGGYDGVLVIGRTSGVVVDDKETGGTASIVIDDVETGGSAS